MYARQQQPSNRCSAPVISPHFQTNRVAALVLLFGDRVSKAKIYPQQRPEVGLSGMPKTRLRGGSFSMLCHPFTVICRLITGNFQARRQQVALAVPRMWASSRWTCTSPGPTYARCTTVIGLVFLGAQKKIGSYAIDLRRQSRLPDAALSNTRCRVLALLNFRNAGCANSTSSPPQKQKVQAFWVVLPPRNTSTK